MLELDSMEMIVSITIKAAVPRLVVLELVRIHFSWQRDQKRVQNFPANYFSGYSFDIQGVLENYPILSLDCGHRCISAVERI